MRPDLDAWHPLWRGSQHAWWSCLQVLCLPFLTLISRVHEETWFQSICLFFILPLTMAWTAGTDATKESQCLGLNLSTVMETLGMDRWDKTGYYVLGFIKICIYLLFLIIIARCQSALLHLLPLHLSCLLTGFLRPWYVTNGYWPLWRFKFNFFYDALVVILQVHWLTQFTHKVRPGDAVLTTCHAKTGNPVPEVQVQSLLVRSSSPPILRFFPKTENDFRSHSLERPQPP